MKQIKKMKNKSVSFLLILFLLVQIISGILFAPPIKETQAASPDTLYTDYPSAQSGSSNPTDFTYSTPFFSTLNKHGEAITIVQIQLTLSTDTGYASPIWNSGDITIASTNNDARTPDIFYGTGNSPSGILEKSQNYIWRIRTKAAAYSDWSSNGTIGMSSGALTGRFYAGAGDGYIKKWGTGWDAMHDASSSGDVYCNDDWDAAVRSHEYSGATDYFFIRSFFPFDTSELPNTADISTALFKLDMGVPSDEDNDADGYIVIVQTTQASTSELVAEDYDQCGTVNSPAEGSQQYDLTGIGTGYKTWTLNETGRGWISNTGYTKLGMREGHDALDHVIDTSANNGIYCYFSEQAGIDRDPYLEITYTSNTAPTTLSSNLSSLDNLYPGTTSTFTAIYTDTDGADNLNQMHIKIDHDSVTDIEYYATEGTADTGLTPIAVSGSDYVTAATYDRAVSGNDITITWNFELDWDWTDSADIEFGVYATDDSDANSGWSTTTTANKIYDNELTFSGTLAASGSIQGSLTNGVTYVSGAETISWSGLTVIYEGSAVSPDESDFNIQITDDDNGSWTQTSGTVLSLNTTSDAITDTSDIHNIDIINIPTGGTDSSTETFTIKVNVSTGGGFISPSPPIIPLSPNQTFEIIEVNNQSIINLNNLKNVHQIAISTTPDFEFISWEPYQEKITLPSTEIVYLKFRSQTGGVSEVYEVETRHCLVPTDNLSNGSLIKSNNNFKVYIINNNYIRHILSGEIFNFYTHLNWNSIQEVDQTQLNNYQESFLIRASNDYKVYEIRDEKKYWLDITVEEFVDLGYDWGEVYVVNGEELKWYEEE